MEATSRLWSAITERIQANQTTQKGTGLPSFNKVAFDVNVTQIDEYSDACKCASNIDTTKCHSSFAF